MIDLSEPGSIMKWPKGSVKIIESPLIRLWQSYFDLHKDLSEKEKEAFVLCQRILNTTSMYIPPKK